MRGLYAIPTRQRRSEWYLADGTMRILFEPQPARAPHRDRADRMWRTGSLEFQPEHGPWLSLLPPTPGAGVPKMLGVLAGSLVGQSDVTHSARLLLRCTHRVGQEPVWDVVLSPSDALSVNIVGGAERAFGQAFVECLVEILRPYVCPLPWPPWIPNDENMPLESSGEPPDLDLRLWSEIRDAFLSALPLECDQVFFGLEVSRLDIDSLDLALLAMRIEDRLGIEMDDATSERFSDAQTIGDYYLIIAELFASSTKAGQS